MREYLNLLVADDRFEDNAAPGFLVNPVTEERLQFDRYYPLHNVAWEFNGAQHYQKTQRFSERKVVMQRVRDYIKQGICLERNITLVVVHAQDLSLEVMRQKASALFPVRDLNDHQRLVTYLEKVAAKYRADIQKAPWRL